MGDQDTFEGWAVLELMGHRKLGGLLSETQIGGASFIRIDVPNKCTATMANWCPVHGDCTCPTANGAGYLVDPFLVPQFGERAGQAPRCHGVDEPLPAVTSHGAGAVVEPSLELVEPVLQRAHGDVDPRRLVEIDGSPYILDIRFRMLQTRELARAMGFDDDGEYLFAGNIGEVTRQIGNAVAVNCAKALVKAILS